MSSEGKREERRDKKCINHSSDDVTELTALWNERKPRKGRVVRTRHTLMTQGPQVACVVEKREMS